MVSRPSSTSGSACGQPREPVVARRVVALAPRERAVAAPANDNQRPTSRRMLNVVGTALAFALAAGGGLYLYLT